MSTDYTLKISSEQAKEMPMVDLAFEVLRSSNRTFYFRELMKEVARIKGISDEGIMDVIAQLYTEINIDGRFARVGSNEWGLKRWYPVEKTEDALSGTPRPRIINDEDDSDDEDLFPDETEDADFDLDETDYIADEEEEETFAAEDTEDLEADEDVDVDVDVEEELDDELLDEEEDGEEDEEGYPVNDEETDEEE